MHRVSNIQICAVDLARAVIRLRHLILGVALLFSLGCAEDRGRDTSQVPRVACPNCITPQTLRSQSAAARVAPRLNQEFATASLRLGAPIFIRIFKESRELELWVKKGAGFVLFKTYPIAFFSGSLGPKFREGDYQAPEGFYYVSPRGMNPRSKYHLAFNIGYPNPFDRAHQRTGSAIMVHGKRVSAGCFAMTDPLIEEIYTIADHALNNGQPFFRVHIFPFRMTEANMLRHERSVHHAFWKNLQEGHAFFENVRRPPDVTVKDRRYVFKADDL